MIDRWTGPFLLCWAAACGPAEVQERPAPAADERERARRTLEASRPPFRTVSLDGRERSLEDAAREVLRQAGLSAELVVPSRGVRVELKEATPLRALDALRLVVEARPAPALDRLRFDDGAAPPEPAIYVRHARIRVEPAAPGKLRIRLTRAPGVRPIPSHDFEILELRDVDGTSLLAEGPLHALLRHHGFTGADLVETLAYRPPASGRIARLRGSFLLLFPQETGRPVLSNAGTMAVEHRGWRLRLESVESRETEHRVVLSARGAVRPLTEPLPGDDRSSSVGGPGVFGTGDVELLAPDGSPIPAERAEQAVEGDADDFTMKLTFRTSRPVEVGAVRVACVYSYFRERVDFEFRDLPLP